MVILIIKVNRGGSFVVIDDDDDDDDDSCWYIYGDELVICLFI